MTRSDDRLSPALRPRTAARVAAVQALFQTEQGEDRPDRVISQFVHHRFGVTLAGDSFEDGFIPEADVTLFTTLVNQAITCRPRTEELLTETLPSSWPVSRLDPVLRALFAVAIGEMSAPDAPPVSVIINEYLDVAHGFFSGDEPRLVNGVLDSVAKRLKASKAQDETGSAAPDADSSDDRQD